MALKAAVIIITHDTLIPTPSPPYPSSTHPPPISHPFFKVNPSPIKPAYMALQAAFIILHLPPPSGQQLNFYSNRPPNRGLHNRTFVLIKL